MIAEATITLLGKQIKMRYCAAAETGYEQMTGKQTTDMFNPEVVETDADGNPTKVNPPKATTDDYIRLALTAIIAAYARIDQEAPISVQEILYDAPPEEVTELIKTVVMLRARWYNLPATIEPNEMNEATEKQADDEKNA